MLELVGHSRLFIKGKFDAYLGIYDLWQKEFKVE